MSNVPEIRVERQAGGWVWAAIMPNAAGAAPQVLHQSLEAFPSEEAALSDARKILQKFQIQSAAQGST
ncbi:hypothetical protein AWB65_05428 [Caballeronia humi]|uniref:Uncharacterized protein n=1 Tax=Caballeronia humi TaxID=326474 RepID=A0A158IVT8_9BURK|nr:hypothetical protein AWB65_05428 [Caballeronia humi]